jgi:hypothetical protein
LRNFLAKKLTCRLFSSWEVVLALKLDFGGIGSKTLVFKKKMIL